MYILEGKRLRPMEISAPWLGKSVNQTKPGDGMELFRLSQCLASAVSSHAQA